MPRCTEANVVPWRMKCKGWTEVLDLLFEKNFRLEHPSECVDRIMEDTETDKQ